MVRSAQKSDICFFFHQSKNKIFQRGEKKMKTKKTKEFFGSGTLELDFIIEPREDFWSHVGWELDWTSSIDPKAFSGLTPDIATGWRDDGKQRILRWKKPPPQSQSITFSAQNAANNFQVFQGDERSVQDQQVRISEQGLPNPRYANPRFKIYGYDAESRRSVHRSCVRAHVIRNAGEWWIGLETAAGENSFSTMRRLPEDFDPLQSHTLQLEWKTRLVYIDEQNWAKDGEENVQPCPLTAHLFVSPTEAQVQKFSVDGAHRWLMDYQGEPCVYVPEWSTWCVKTGASVRLVLDGKEMLAYDDDLDSFLSDEEICRRAGLMFEKGHAVFTEAQNRSRTWTNVWTQETHGPEQKAPRKFPWIPCARQPLTCVDEKDGTFKISRAAFTPFADKRGDWNTGGGYDIHVNESGENVHWKTQSFHAENLDVKTNAQEDISHNALFPATQDQDVKDKNMKIWQSLFWGCAVSLGIGVLTLGWIENKKS
jgi:hypothetical protein